MDEYSTYLILISATLIAMYLLCVMVFLLYPVLAYTIFQIEEPWLPVFVLGLDINTKAGFVTTSIYHLVVIYLSGAGFSFVDGLFFNVVFNILIMSKLQCNQLLTLNEELDTAQPSKLMIRIRLANFFLMNQEMEKYSTNNQYFTQFKRKIIILISTHFIDLLK